MLPMQILQLMRGNNPQQVLMSMLKQQANNNPMIGNVVQMMEQDDSVGIERLARNLAKEKGVNVDEMYEQLKQQLTVTRN